MSYIEREALIEIAEQQGHVSFDDIINEPAADVAPVRHGRWEHDHYEDCTEQFEIVAKRLVLIATLEPAHMRICKSLALWRMDIGSVWNTTDMQTDSPYTTCGNVPNVERKCAERMPRKPTRTAMAAGQEWTEVPHDLRTSSPACCYTIDSFGGLMMAKIRLFDVICTACTGGLYLIWKQILED